MEKSLAQKNIYVRFTQLKNNYNFEKYILRNDKSIRKNDCIL